MTIKALVHGGRLVVNEPSDLPEGTEVELLPLDPGDWLDDADRQALHNALAESEADIAVGGCLEGTARAPLALNERRVRFTATASGHVDRERAWWQANRDYQEI